MPNFLEALRNRVMDASPELKHVFLSSSNQGPDYPFVIITKLFEDEVETGLPGETFKEVRLQFSLFSHGDMEAETLGKSVYRSLKPIPGNPRLVFDDGYEMARHPGRFTGPTDTLDNLGDQKVWRSMFDYTWDIGVNDV
jgi:hypothetical protein